MDSARLSEFYRSVTHWPRSKLDMGSVTDKLCRLLDAPFVGLCAHEEDDKISYSSAKNAPDGDSSVIEEMVRNQMRRADKLFTGASSSSNAAGSGEAMLREVPATSQNQAFFDAVSVQSLAATIIPRALLPADVTTGLGPQRKSEAGMLLIGTSKPLGNGARTLLVAAVQHLADLASIARLEAAIQLRGQFLSIASHELKTPLTSIYGILQLQERMARMKRDSNSSSESAEDEERQKSFMKILIRQVQRLNELIDGLLDVSRIQNGRFMVEPSDTDVAAVVREAVSSRTSTAQDNGVTLHVDAPEHFKAWVDPVRMEEVVNNLIMNAIRFSPEGGVVWIRLRGEGGAFRLTVRDQGPSVPVEDRDRIFRPFERAQRTSRLGGLGLGLFISRQIAQLHGGNVTLIESVPGKGNVFEAYFPEHATGRATFSVASSA